MKEVIILNASPRKNWNTYKMCESFANGVNKAGGQAKIINLYDINFKGCRSCFACKLKGGKYFGRCAYPDALTPILDEISQAYGVVLASPIYFGDVTGVARSLIERLFFPFFERKSPSRAGRAKRLSPLSGSRRTGAACTERLPQADRSRRPPDRCRDTRRAYRSRGRTARARAAPERRRG